MNSILFTLYMSSNYTLNRSRCNGCTWGTLGKYTESMKIMKLATINQRITNSIGQSESQYLGNLGSLEVWRDSSCSPVGLSKSGNISNRASQASDRYIKARVPKTAVVPTRGNSTKRTQTSLRPGALGPGGSGVDVKHNSYARYLAKKKGGVILGEKTPSSQLYKQIISNKQSINNKFMKPSVVARGIMC
tara:strand:+ start:324 stop:893 length:570 start_codon:yes stop_codon:yes gene_type:complete